jgi:hypothetical protein
MALAWTTQLSVIDQWKILIEEIQPKLKFKERFRLILNVPEDATRRTKTHF